MKLESGKIYLTRNGTQVGPMRIVEGMDYQGSLYAWGDDSSPQGNWNLYGRVYNDIRDPFDIVSEVMDSFNVGDKVKATTPEIVCDSFEDQVGVVIKIHRHDHVTGEQVVVIDYGDNHQQFAHVLKDGVVLVGEDKESQETPQEDDEWGPWVEDYEGSLSSKAMIIETDDRGWYRRHKVKKPVPKKQIEVGGKYACGNGFYWVCIYISGNKAWLNRDDGETAYVWTLDGESISLNKSYNINFSISPSADNRVPF